MQHFLKGLIGWQVMQRHHEEHALLLGQKPKPAPKPYQPEFYRDLAECLTDPVTDAIHQDRLDKILYMIGHDANFACGAAALTEHLATLIPKLEPRHIPRALYTLKMLASSLQKETPDHDPG